MSLSRAPTNETTLKRHRDILAHDFNIQPERIVDVRGGWSATAFLADTHERRYFLKVYDGTKQAVIPLIERIDHYIGVLGWLANTAVLRGRIVTPVPTPCGQYKVQSGTDTYLLFDYVEGVTPGTLNCEQMGELANILAGLHGLNVDNVPGIIRLQEDTSIGFCEQLNAFLCGDIQSAPGEFMRSYKTLLQAAVRKTTHLRDSVRLGAAQLSLCHTDAHGNNVIQSDRLVLADWEGLCVAPAEADLFMYAGDSNWDTFIDAYRLARPGFILNEDMLLFYIYRRYLEDISYYLTRLLHDDPCEQEADEVYRRLRNIISLVEKVIAGVNIS